MKKEITKLKTDIENINKSEKKLKELKLSADENSKCIYDKIKLEFFSKDFKDLFIRIVGDLRTPPTDIYWDVNNINNEIIIKITTVYFVEEKQIHKIYNYNIIHEKIDCITVNHANFSNNEIYVTFDELVEIRNVIQKYLNPLIES